jgi:hypothetical protein
MPHVTGRKALSEMEFSIDGAAGQSLPPSSVPEIISDTAWKWQFPDDLGPGLIDEATEAFLLEGLEAFIRAVEA